MLVAAFSAREAREGAAPCTESGGAVSVAKRRLAGVGTDLRAALCNPARGGNRRPWPSAALSLPSRPLLVLLS